MPEAHVDSGWKCRELRKHIQIASKLFIVVGQGSFTFLKFKRKKQTSKFRKKWPQYLTGRTYIKNGG
jgi:hypothetical protein